ncbi:MAG: ATP-binding protein, partial [Polyangiaceae bacterium]
MLRRVIGEDVELRVVAMATPGFITVDPGQLEQVIVNMAVNARDAMPRGGTLTIETSEIDLDAAYAADHPGVTPGRHVVLALTDTGEGMDKETQARMFEPFFTTKVVGKGTGLGLSTVFGIVQQSGATISVESEVGKGSSFRLYFPLAASDHLPSPTIVRISKLPGGSETILLVEDDER